MQQNPQASPANAPVNPALSGNQLVGRQEPFLKRIDGDAVIRANEILQKYKAGKANLEKRIVSSENWWKMRNWREIDGGNPDDKKPVTAWLFNVIMGKHADAIEAYPEPNILPREAGDKEEAKVLSSILPCVLEQNGFEQTYSDCAWQKMKTGTGIYGVFWDKTKLNGLGDISIRKADALNLFWKPGITDIESSPNLFSVDIVDNDELEAKYPVLQGKLRGNSMTVAKYVYDDHVDTANTSVVVDWYYKRFINGRTVLHYCKYVGDTVLYASENLPELYETGYYTDGEYPFVFDPLFPIEGSPCGYGYIDIGKSPQEYIDLLNQAIVKNAVMASTPRYFIRSDGSVNEKEFTDWTKPLVHVSGNLGEDTLKQIVVSPLDSIYVAIMNNKIEELKFTSGNQDVQNGTVGGGVTAASAIAALQESAGRSSRASTKAAYRAYAKIITKCIERVRQFYDLPRQFRILGQYGSEEYVTYRNSGLMPQYQGNDFGIDMGYRLPVFDIKVAPEKATPYTKISQNELALQLYGQGFFNPQMTTQALATLDMMEFDGKDAIEGKIANNGTLQQQLQLWQQFAVTLAAQYAPQMAQGLVQAAAAGVTPGGQSGTAAPTSGTDLGQENKVVRDSRARATAAGQPR